jgi:hypothetical protein
MPWLDENGLLPGRGVPVVRRAALPAPGVPLVPPGRGIGRGAPPGRGVVVPVVSVAPLEASGRVSCGALGRGCGVALGRGWVAGAAELSDVAARVTGWVLGAGTDEASAAVVSGAVAVGAVAVGAVAVGADAVGAGTLGAGRGAGAVGLAADVLAGAAAAPADFAAFMFSFNRRTTGGSMVLEAERTNSPMSFSFLRRSLLSSPSSFASS